MTDTLRLGEVVTIERGTTYKSALLGQPGPVLLGLGTIQRHGGFRPDALRTYGGESPDKLLVRPGELYASLKDVTQTADLLGAVAMVPEDGPVGRLTQDTVRLDLRTSAIDVEYLYWILRTPQYRNYCRSHATGTTTMGLPREDFFAFEFPAPNAPRLAVVDLLEALDDKIAVNAKVATLVDHLLSTRFAQISAGRPSVCLRSIARINQRSTRPQVGKLRYLDISSVGQGTYDFPPESDWETAPGRARRLVSRGDVVWSTVRPNRRSHALVLDNDDKLVGSTGLAVITPEQGRAAAVYDAVRTDVFVAYLEAVAEGSAYPAVRAERFLEAPVPDLEPELWDRFEALALPLRELVHVMKVESRQLAHTRDELLPLLISGKIRVKDAQKTVEGIS